MPVTSEDFYLGAHAERKNVTELIRRWSESMPTRMDHWKHKMDGLSTLDAIRYVLKSMEESIERGETCNECDDFFFGFFVGGMSEAAILHRVDGYAKDPDGYRAMFRKDMSPERPLPPVNLCGLWWTHRPDPTDHEGWRHVVSTYASQSERDEGVNAVHVAYCYTVGQIWDITAMEPDGDPEHMWFLRVSRGKYIEAPK